jgi:hypothetical protein
MPRHSTSLSAAIERHLNPASGLERGQVSLQCPDTHTAASRQHCVLDEALLACVGNLFDDHASTAVEIRRLQRPPQLEEPSSVSTSLATII